MEVAVKADWELIPTQNGYHVRIDGELMTFASAIASFGVVSSAVARQRIKEGWPVERAITVPTIEPAYWKRMTVVGRVKAVQGLMARGVGLRDMPKHFRGADTRTILAFAQANGIEVPEEEPEGKKKPEERLFGWNMHSRSVDGHGVPGSGPMSLLELNNRTCRFPLWGKDEAIGKFCGDRVHTGPYCEFHSRKGEHVVN